jgi:glycogen(starch) synthase
MEICMMSRSVPAHGLGGMERHLHLLGRELVRLGHNVTVLTTAPRPESQFQLAKKLLLAPPEPIKLVPATFYDGSKKRGEPLRTEVEGVVYIFLAGTEPGVYSRSWWTASRWALRQLNPDIVHSQSIGAFGVLGDIRKRRLPLVATCHGTPISDTATKLRSFGLRTNPADLLATISKLPHHMKVYGAARRVIAVSPNLAEHLGAAGLVQRDRITVVLNGIDTQHFSPEGAAGAPSGRGPVIFSLARIVQEKGFQFLVRAMPEIRKEHAAARLVIGGDGPYMDPLRALAEEEHVKEAVDFTGPILEDDLPTRYRSCDIFALATTHVEGLPLVLPEALACGRPIAASRIGGIPDVVREGSTGALFEPGNQESVTRTLLELLSDGGRLVEMGKNAREDAVRRFGAARMARETADVYNTVIGTSPAQ